VSSEWPWETDGGAFLDARGKMESVSEPASNASPTDAVAADQKKIISFNLLRTKAERPRPLHDGKTSASQQVRG